MNLKIRNVVLNLDCEASKEDKGERGLISEIYLVI